MVSSSNDRSCGIRMREAEPLMGYEDPGREAVLGESCAHINIHWIGLRENLQETMVFTVKYRAFL